MTHQPMVRPVAPTNLRNPMLPHVAAPVSAPAQMPPVLQGPTPVNPAGPANIQPIAPGMMKV